MISAICYVRVSTEEQDPGNQVEYVAKWCKERGFELLKFYVDYGISGVKDIMERPGFREMLKDLDEGALSPRPQALLVYELSRLARSINELVKVWDLLENKYGLIIVSVNEKESFLWSLDSTLRNFLRVVMGYVAEMEREMVRQRTRAAMARASAKVPRVYDRLPRGEVVKLYKDGWGVYRIAKRYRVSTTTVIRILREEGLYEARADVCPRCLHRMKLVDRVLTDGRLREKYYCSNCGFEYST